MRVDTELLIKQRFWIGLGLFFILWVVSAFLIKSAEAGTKAKADFESSKTSIEAARAKSPKNETFNQPWIEYGTTYRNQKEKVWSAAWEVQKDMFDWPWNSEAKLNRLKYPDDEIKFPERIMYREDLWKTQFQDLEAVVAPVEFAGGTAGFVRIMLPGAGRTTPGATSSGAPPADFGGIINRANRNQPAATAPVDPTGTVWDNFWQRVPTEEEMWLAQEDYWIKRELLRIVKDAVVNVARFTEIKEETKKPLPEGVVARHLFRNDLWEIDFMIEMKGTQRIISDRSTIKNLHPAHRTVPLSASPTSGGLHFLVRQGKKTYPFSVDGEPLPYLASAPFKKKWKVDSIFFEKGPFELEQVFEASNSPVREIVDLLLGRQSSRTASLPLLTSKLIQPKADDLGTPPTGVAAAAAPQKSPSPTQPAPAPAAGAAAGAGDARTPNGLNRLRYIFRTDQCRHVPVALLLIVDQAHMHEVLVAMSNSRLRVQTTQVQFRHISGFQSSSPESTSARPGGSPHVALEEDPNLVEMAIYGIASLYERFPPKNATPPADAGKGATPTTPAATTPATPAAAGSTPASGAAKTAPTDAASPGKAAETGKAGSAPDPTKAGSKTIDQSKAPPPTTPLGAAKPAEPKAADKPKDATPNKP